MHAEGLCYNERMKRGRILSICIALLMTALCANTLAGTEQAENLTARCTFDFGAYYSAEGRVLYDPNHYQVFDAQASFSLTWKEAWTDARLCLQWREMPTGVCIEQYDADGVLLEKEQLGPYPETVTSLREDARMAIVRAGADGMQVFRCAVYGAGELPDPFHDWQELPERLDYLLIATHPDDDVLFLGSVPPVYGAERGYVGTVAYVTCQNRVRMSEAENCAWTLGIRVRPLFIGMPDISMTATEQEKQAFHYDELLQNMVRIYRQCRPAVVFAQDLNGEYGHWQHRLTARAAREAFALAADPDFDPESAQLYGTWQVQKLFLHLYEKNQIMVDAYAKLNAFGGLDAYQVARLAYHKHASQLEKGHRITRTDDGYPFNRFGMAEGVVPLGSDVFDNIGEEFSSAYVPPTPEPTAEPTEAPTIEPTAAPTEKPTAAPTATPTPVPTAEPTGAPSTTPVTVIPTDRCTGTTIGTILLITGGVLIGLLAGVLVIRAKKQRRTAKKR